MSIGRRIVTCGIALSIWIGIASAQQTCLTCGSTAPGLQSYIDMTIRIMGSIQTMGGEGASLGRFTVPGLFGGGIVDLQDEQRDLIERTADAIKRNLEQKAQAIAAVGSILFDDVRDVSRNMFSTFRILVYSEPIVRDRAQLQQLSNSIQDKKYELALGAAWMRSITDADRTQIQDIINQYREQGLVLNGNIATSATYRNVIAVSQKINRAFEALLLDDEGDLTMFMQEFSQGGVAIRFNMAAIEQIHVDYICARFAAQCKGSFQQFVTDIKAVSSTNLTAAKKSGQNIVDASKKLKHALTAFGKQTANFFAKKSKTRSFTEEEKEALSRQDQLLRTIYGSDFKGMQSNQTAAGTNIPFINLRTAVDISELRKSPSTIQTEDTIKIMTPKKKKNEDIIIPARIVLPEALQNTLVQTMQDEYHRGQRMLQFASTVEPTQVTIYIPLLASQLETVRELIGSKDNKGTIIYNLGQACTLQCINAGGTCRW